VSHTSYGAVSYAVFPLCNASWLVVIMLEQFTCSLLPAVNILYILHSDTVCLVIGWLLVLSPFLAL